MARSDKTVAELEAMAMLLGRGYDPNDHTFTKPLDSNTSIFDCLCADTLEAIYENGWGGVYKGRQRQVRDGEIGAANYEEWKNN